MFFVFSADWPGTVKIERLEVFISIAYVYTCILVPVHVANRISLISFHEMLETMQSMKIVRLENFVLHDIRFKKQRQSFYSGTVVYIMHM